MDCKKTIKVDNWGAFFLQRLHNFFNKTDYCDLTLQFNDNSQLKVHRLVLNACTDFFSQLEKQCNVINGVLLMPADMQANIVVPIVHFLYSGLLEFDISLFDRIFDVVQKINLTVLLNLLKLHRLRAMETNTSLKPRTFKAPVRINEGESVCNSRFDTCYENSSYKIKDPLSLSLQKCYDKNKEISTQSTPPKKILKIDNSNTFQYQKRDNTKHLTPSNLKPSSSPSVIVNKSKRKSIINSNNDSTDIRDHTTIISEVLKKYPNFLKNASIKLMENKKNESYESQTLKNISEYETEQKENVMKSSSKELIESKTTVLSPKSSSDQPKHINSKAMHALIAKGAENITGPWLCLKCGVNGRPISIPSYKRFRHHLINTHKEKIDCRLCKHCGWRSRDSKTLINHVLTNHKKQITISEKAAEKSIRENNAIIDLCDDDADRPITYPHKTKLFDYENIDLSAGFSDIQEPEMYDTINSSYLNKLKEFEPQEWISIRNSNESEYLELMKLHIIVEDNDEQI